ncbi:Arsenate reductase [Austwickia sp. TVS 96-490-7B]|uniref:ArsC/Spx/MgsR family protein n=1 Tax=Austwickia sp. TVS 96-490-7B TaxID=2830843 RepID=UPI001C5A52F5|nr:ArsC/Spx/MgsR family protein [Austwickia sp. TVS 96-490-7B]MBW3086723.1 Arsenate reductase [Austwickia sp. TVS 96-490-7B]
MSDVQIFHNPRCSKSRAALSAAADAGADVRIVDYLRTAPTRDELLAVLAILEDAPSALVRRDAGFAHAGLTDADVHTAEQVADVLAAHPELMERPVLVRGNRAIIGRPTERVAAFLADE